MRSKIIATLALLALLTVSLAQTYTFAGLEYGANPKMVEDALSERGYTYKAEIEEDGKTIRVFEGTMLDYPVFVGPVFDDYNRLEAVGVNFYINGADKAARDATLIRLYEDLMSALNNRYGKPFMSKSLIHADGRIDDSTTTENNMLARHMWVKLAAAMSGSPDALGLVAGIGPGPESTELFRDGTAATEDDAMITLGYIGDPSTGDFDTGTAVDDL